MAIVTTRELYARMGDPDWSPEVRRDADRLLTTLTATLAGRLSTFIEPGAERTERAAVSERGMVVTDHPVFEVLRIDGVAAVRLPGADPDGADAIDDAPAAVPPGWRLQDHRVYRAQLGVEAGTFPNPSIYASQVVDTGGLAGMLGGSLFSRGSLLGGPGPVPHVTIVYRPGWGRHEALRGAVLEKATALMMNRHDDTITARQLEGQTPPKMTEDWTADEVAALGAFRSIAGPEWTRV
jgi:hypothetical protein